MSAADLALPDPVDRSNRKAVVEFWDGDLQYTPDVLAQLRSI